MAAKNVITADIRWPQYQVSKMGVSHDWSPFGEDFDTGQFKNYNVNTPKISWIENRECEIIKSIGAIAPRAVSIAEGTMDIDQWDVQGVWEETGYTGNLKQKYLEFKDGRPNLIATNEYGNVQNKTGKTLYPNFIFRYYQHPTDLHDNDPHMMWVVMKNIITSNSQYAIVIPSDGEVIGADFNIDADINGPTLIGRTGPSENWIVLANIDNIKTNSKFMFSMFTVESIGQYIIIKDQEGKEWSFGEKWKNANGLETVCGLTERIDLQVIFTGGSGGFNVRCLTYPKSASITANKFLHLSAYHERKQSFLAANALGHSSTSVSIAEAPDDDATKALLRFRPKLTFTTTNANYRKAVFNAQSYAMPTLTVPAADAKSNHGTPKDFSVLSASGSMQIFGSNQSANLKVHCATSMIDSIKMNREINLAYSPDNSATDYQYFNGRISNVTLNKENPNNTVILDITCVDIMEILSKHKIMWGSCAYEGWNIRAAITYITKRAGINSVSYHANVSEAVMGDDYYLPYSEDRKDLNLKFNEDTTVFAALQEICESRDLMFGVDNQGDLWVERATDFYARTSGTYDVEITDGLTDSIRYLKRNSEFASFANIAIANSEEEQLMVMKTGSISTSSDPSYIADDWYAWRELKDADTPVSLIGRMVEEYFSKYQMVEFATTKYYSLLPGQYVKINIPNCGIASTSIIRIIKMDWKIDKNGCYSATYSGAIVEE